MFSGRKRDGSFVVVVFFTLCLLTFTLFAEKKIVNCERLWKDLTWVVFSPPFLPSEEVPWIIGLDNQTTTHPAANPSKKKAKDPKTRETKESKGLTEKKGI